MPQSNLVLENYSPALREFIALAKREALSRAAGRSFRCIRAIQRAAITS
jgi:hypothetical protein